MKRLVYSFILVAVTTVFFACNESPEKKLIGKWSVESIDIENLDEIIQQLIDAQMPMIDEQIKQIDEQIAALENEEEKAALETQKAQIVAQKEKLTVDAMKEEYKSNFESMKNVTIEYKEDKTYEMVAEGNTEKGTWILSEDGKTLTSKTEGAEGEGDSVTIVELTAEKMIVSSEVTQGENTMKMKMTLKK